MSDSSTDQRSVSALIWEVIYICEFIRQNTDKGRTTRHLTSALILAARDLVKAADQPSEVQP